MGRPHTTGRFATRRELVEKIKFLYETTNLSMNAIAKNVHISPITCGKIVDDFDAAMEVQVSKKPRRAEKETDRPLTFEEMEAIDRMTENAKNVLGTCGHGWMPESLPVHLDPRTMNDVFASNDLDVEFVTRPVNLGKWARRFAEGPNS